VGKPAQSRVVKTREPGGVVDNQTMRTILSLRHFLLALAVVAVWGTNFVVIKLALGQMPPLLFATLRFLVVVLPMVFFLPRPAVPWRNLAAYGLLIGVGQFGLLFVAMNGHISPGLASLVIQTQVFFTIGLAMLMAGESLQRVQWLALMLGAAGLAVIVSHTDGSTTLLGLGLILLAALSWAGGNLVSRAAGRIKCGWLRTPSCTRPAPARPPAAWRCRWTRACRRRSDGP
jgi:O-acetylserine/cysteine efflux transporter